MSPKNEVWAFAPARAQVPRALRTQSAKVPIVFVSGPVRSGKSRFAERLAGERGGTVTYVATARIDPEDAEWCARIAHHAARRPAHWRTVETARAGGGSLEDVLRDAAAEETLLVDSFGTWVAAMMHPGCDVVSLEATVTAAVDALFASDAYAIVVCEEVGWGVVPEYPAGRAFRDVVGRAHQRIAGGASAAYLVVAGYALDLRRYGRLVSGE